MAIETGTASGIIDLYRRFRDFVLNDAGWSQVLGAAKHTDTEGLRGMISDNIDARDLFDGDTATFIQFSDQQEVKMEFFDPLQIGQVKVTMPDLSGGGPVLASPGTIRLETSSDGVFWTFLQEWSGQSEWNDLETRTFIISTPPTTRWLRFLIPVSRFGNTSNIAQIQLFDALGIQHYINLGDYGTRFCAKSSFGFSGVYLHLECSLYLDDSAPYYNLGLRAAADMSDDPDTDLGLTKLRLHNESAWTFAFLRDTPMPYWFYGIDRFIYAFVQAGNTFRQFGTGYLLPYATPEQYPFPAFVGAECGNRDFNWELDANGDLKGFTNPGDGALQIFLPSQVWGEFQNYRNSGGSDSLAPNVTALWPGCTLDYAALRNAPGTNDTNGNHILFPLIARNIDGDIYGELPDIYAVPSLSLSSVDTVTVQAQLYRVFQNLWRNSPEDFCAVKEA